MAKVRVRPKAQVASRTWIVTGTSYVDAQDHQNANRHVMRSSSCDKMTSWLSEKCNVFITASFPFFITSDYTSPSIYPDYFTRTFGVSSLTGSFLQVTGQNAAPKQPHSRFLRWGCILKN